MKTSLLAILFAYAVLWVWLLARSRRRRSWRAVGHCLAYHGLVIGAAVMVLPFYWMVATSLKDFQGANQSPPTWLPLGTHYFAPPPVARASAGKGASDPDDLGNLVEVGLVQDASKPWRETRQKQEILVAPIDRLNEPSARYSVPGSAIRRARRPEWGNYVEAWNAPAKGNPLRPVTFTRYFQVSIVTAVVTTFGTLITSILAAYAFAKMKFRGKGVLFYLVLATMMAPGQALLIPNFLILARLPDYTFGMRWLDNYPALIAPWLASVFSIFLLRQFFYGIPDDLWDAAQIDGAGRFRYLWQVVVPLSKPALITAGIFIFLGQWNSLLWPLIVTTRPEMRTLMVGLQTFNEELRGDFNLLMAASTIAIAPVAVLFFMLQHFFIEGIARTGIK
ncbi:MAG TPA: carbohydrate ABC transporter permease [Sumerlaeia bacterium]|nr:carbohydrate ABC transporter permease [Sumerlaeia bacterium]